MRTMIMMIAVPVASLLLAAAPARAEEGLSVEIKFAKGLEKFKPVDEGTSFEPSKIYAWTLIKGGKGSFKVQHLWYKNDKQVWKHLIPVRGSRFPTWSWLNVTPGDWKVEVTDEEGKVIQTGTFTVKKAS